MNSPGYATKSAKVADDWRTLRRSAVSSRRSKQRPHPRVGRVRARIRRRKLVRRSRAGIPRRGPRGRLPRHHEPGARLRVALGARGRRPHQRAACSGRRRLLRVSARRGPSHPVGHATASTSPCDSAPDRLRRRLHQRRGRRRRGDRRRGWSGRQRAGRHRAGRRSSARRRGRRDQHPRVRALGRRAHAPAGADRTGRRSPGPGLAPPRGPPEHPEMLDFP